MGKNAMRGLDAEVGEVWAYRARPGDPLTPVTVLRHDPGPPARVVVHHGVGTPDGLEERVTPNRLKVQWDQVNDFMAEEARREAFCELGPEYLDFGPRWESPEELAVTALFRGFVDDDVASLGMDIPCLRIVSADRLSRLSGVASGELTGHDLTHEDGAVTVAPWPVALEVAKSLATRFPDQVILQLEEEERGVRRLLADAQNCSEHGSEERSLDIRLDDERGERQSRDLRREWVGDDALLVRGEVAALRAEIQRVTVAARAAVAALERAGCRAEADELREALEGDRGAAG
ncbi:hypothetical protein [Brachybacterium sp.]|uniref:hypothetical protein n=1 Tax=Brachybacterium sp. TaxID=1891286 RepID=UPI002ED1B5AD